MEPEDITEIIMRRLDNIMKQMLTVDITSVGFTLLSAKFNELTETLGEIRALKENETKD